MANSRPDWDEYFMNIAEAVSARATCDRGKCAAVITKNNVIVSTGYVGAPKGSPHCDEVGHLMKTVVNEDGTSSNHCMRTAHAEANAICMAAKTGAAVEGGTIYTKIFPCRNCAMLIANSGIKRVVAKILFHGSSQTESEQILKNAGVEVVVLENKSVDYKNQ